MKKVLSVAMASAMVLGMGANAFAIEYNTASKDTAAWPEKFQFDGALFVTDKNGNLKEDATTAIEDEETADFAPGDVIWMPLYAKDQVVYSYEYKPGTGATEDKTVKADVTFTVSQGEKIYKFTDNKWYRADSTNAEVGDDSVVANNILVDSGEVVKSDAGEFKVYYRSTVTINGTYDTESAKYYIAGDRYKTEKAFKEALAKQGNDKNAYITVVKEGNEGSDESISKPIDKEVVKDYYNYTGNIDKDWSINLKDSTNAVEEIVEKAELYKATTKDAQKYGTAVNGVYVKVTLKDEWKHVSEETLKYYVYVAENNTEKKTNQVWVSGTYANDNVKTVNFDWTNNANTPAVWEAKENGTAVFDYNDVAFFTVKMYKGEKLYLDLKTAYDRIVSNEIYDATGAEVESFYNFVTADANFSREGELVLVTDDDTLVPYKVLGDGEYEEVENYEYVKGYQIAHTKEKVNGFKFNTKELGNYILSDEIVAEEEVEEPETEEPATETPAEPEAPVVEEKPNPNTGAEDFVGLAVSLAVVSVAAAGALALKK